MKFTKKDFIGISLMILSFYGVNVLFNYLHANDYSFYLLANDNGWFFFSFFIALFINYIIYRIFRPILKGPDITKYSQFKILFKHDINGKLKGLSLAGYIVYIVAFTSIYHLDLLIRENI
ncbi:MAG TPA: hypothetical protein DCL21_02035, partial [Alphaproteobacteria bacterium]|nr:hypothetical protein [Alphaproteobacteria bacterium]